MKLNPVGTLKGTVRIRVGLHQPDVIISMKLLLLRIVGVRVRFLVN